MVYAQSTDTRLYKSNKNKRMTNKEQLREEFEKTKGSASWISADIYPNGRVFTNDYVEFLEYEIEKRDKGNNAFKKWIIEKLEEGKKIAANEIGNLEAKIQELEAANKKGMEYMEAIKEYQMNNVQLARTTEVYKIAEKALNQRG